VNWMLEHPERGANCELDCDSFIGLIQQAQASRAPVVVGKVVDVDNVDIIRRPVESDMNDVNEEHAIDVTDIDNEIFSTDWSQLFSLTDIDSNVVCYIAGYISMKINKSTACSQCRKAYVTSKENQKHNPTGQHSVFITTKEFFSWAKYGLVIPSAALYDLCCAIKELCKLISKE